MRLSYCVVAQRSELRAAGTLMERYWLIGGGVLLGALLIGSIVLTLVRDPERFIAGTAESAVQVHLETIDRGDVDSVRAALSSELLSECSDEELFRQVSRERDRDGTIRITLENTDIVQETTFVTVSVHTFRSGGLFGSSERTRRETFSLKELDGTWRFVEMPWPLVRCRSNVDLSAVPVPGTAEPRSRAQP